MVYARASDKPDRYSSYLSSFRQWAADADRIFRKSAAETGGERHIRFVHDADCVLRVDNVTLTPSGDNDFLNMRIQLRMNGYNKADRKYLVFFDATFPGFPGVADLVMDDTASSSNKNNLGYPGGGPSLAFAFADGWSGDVVAHELMHVLGGVQSTAPHATAAGHCTDESDLMCYADGPGVVLTSSCPAWHELLFDCNHDDYFSTSPPPGSYLATHWNAADNLFLVVGAQPLWGYVWADDPLAARYTPHTSYQRNATGALNTIVRTGTGAYTVTFPNLGVFGGTVHVTAHGTGSESCKVQNWFPSGIDLNVYVRCFSSGGTPVDARFTGSYSRPLMGVESKEFAYVWANSPSAASYTPSTSFQANSSRGGPLNTITRSATGVYQVRLPGLAGPGGMVKVTAYGVGNETCKVGSWLGSGWDELVNVVCHNPAGIPTDAAFTMTFHRSVGLFGPLTTAARAFLWADQASASSYTPSLSYQFNSTGGTNTITRSATGVYQARLPGLATSRGHVQVAAYGAGDSSRCKLAGWSASGSDELVNVRCFSSAGVPVDVRYTLSFVD